MKKLLKPWILTGALSLCLSPLAVAQIGTTQAPLTVSTDIQQEARFLGQVKWFHEGVGYGYIIPNNKPDGGRDIIVYFSGIRDHKALIPGEIVEYSVRQNAANPEAVRVTRVG